MIKSKQQLRDDFSLRLLRLKQEAGKIGLPKTMQKLVDAELTFGIEVQEQYKESKIHPRYR